MRDTILKLEEKVVSGEELTRNEAKMLLEVNGSDRMFLFASANRIREYFCGDKAPLCGIVNAKSGSCSEDCVFCSQAARHQTSVEKYNLMKAESMVEAAQRSAKIGAHAFGIVAAWKGIGPGAALDEIIKALRLIKEDGQVKPHLSLGLIEDDATAVALAKAGAVEYNINLESSPNFFPNICSTHSIQERINTIHRVKAAGMKVCSGGIFGLGESVDDRVDLAFALKSVQPNTVPLNFYHHTDGNRVDSTKIAIISPLEALTICAVFRFVLPRVVLKIAGGREQALGELQSMMFFCGINSTMVGDYLTTGGRPAKQDVSLVQLSGLH